MQLLTYTSQHKDVLLARGQLESALSQFKPGIFLMSQQFVNSNDVHTSPNLFYVAGGVWWGFIKIPRMTCIN